MQLHSLRDMLLTCTNVMLAGLRCCLAHAACRYVGGETRLVGLKRTHSYSAFLQQLSKVTAAVWDEVSSCPAGQVAGSCLASCLLLHTPRCALEALAWDLTVHRAAHRVCAVTRAGSGCLPSATPIACCLLPRACMLLFFGVAAELPSDVRPAQW